MTRMRLKVILVLILLFGLTIPWLYYNNEDSWKISQKAEALIQLEFKIRESAFQSFGFAVEIPADLAQWDQQKDGWVIKDLKIACTTESLDFKELTVNFGTYKENKIALIMQGWLTLYPSTSAERKVMLDINQTFYALEENGKLKINPEYKNSGDWKDLAMRITK